MPQCNGCTKESRPGRATCMSCGRRQSDYVKRRYLQRNARGLCGLCGRNPVSVGGHSSTGDATCAPCREKIMARYYARKQAQVTA